MSGFGAMVAPPKLNLISPLTTPLPEAPADDVLTQDQWTTLWSIGETVIPSIVAVPNDSPAVMTVHSTKYDEAVQIIGSDSSSDAARVYLAESATSLPLLKDLIRRFVVQAMSSDARAGFGTILSALNFNPTSLPLRVIAKAVTFIFKSFWLKTSPTFRQVLDYPVAPAHGTPGKGYDYQFMQFEAGEEPEIIETDVVVIGSGCGGGVSAKNLAEAGLKVIVVEKGFYFAPKYLPMSEADAGPHLFENGGAEASDDSSISLVSASVWGGGGTVNWSASFQTQNFVRQEWSDGGLPFFTSSQFQKCLDRVCERMGVSTEHIHHNINNRVLMDGAKKLGYHVSAVPQNTGGKQHYCGYCMLGCGSAEKQGPVVSFLPDAARAGAQFIEGFRAEKVLFEKINGKKTATGVQGVWRSRDTEGGVTGKGASTRTVIIKAKRTIVSSGSLQSPLLLLRSGLTNPQIGRNLHLHPATHMFAVFDEKTNPWEGSILTSVIDDLEDLDGHGHGAKLEASTMIPGNSLTLLPWTSGLDFKSYAANFRNMVCGFSLCRDRDTGRVWADREGRCRIAYTPSAFDRRSNLEGMLALAKIFYVAGAREIISSVSGLPRFVRQDNDPSTSPDGPSVNDPAFKEWHAQMRKKGMPSPAATFASAHQMGSCRMGSHERNSVVDSTGAVWGTQNLYVADASVFPSASGVNPMVTNMAISDWISRGVAEGLKSDERRDGPRL